MVNENKYINVVLFKFSTGSTADGYMSMGREQGIGVRSNNIC